MAKILIWWTQFLVDLEAGKRVIAIFIVVTGCLSYALVNVNNKLDAARMGAIDTERMHTEEILKIKDSATNIILRNAIFYNDKTENIYKDRIDKLNEVEAGYRNIKKINDKIVSNSKK